jgi:ABC-type Fe3+/spermidine/putrescine transport system ATPase subunit
MTAKNQAPDAASPLLEIRGLGVVYATGQKALNAASLVVNPGEFVVLLGPSGAGKSTLLRAINGLVQSSEGTVQFNGPRQRPHGTAWHALRVAHAAADATRG